MPAPINSPIRFTVTDTSDSMFIRDMLTQALGEAEAADVVLAHGGAWIGRERVTDGERRVAAGDEVTISRPPTGSYQHVHIEPNSILFEDADLLALDKPPGVYVEATPWDIHGHVRGALEQFLSERDQHMPRLHLAHRLDRDTSGVLLFSKNPAVNAALQASFAGGKAHKQYICRCQGEPAEDHFELNTGHGRGAKGQFRVYPLDEIGRVLPQGGGTVKGMQTRFAVLQRGGDNALVQAEPLTGRTHQIRLHLAYLGHPLLGDTRYGGAQLWGTLLLPYHLLHAARLSLPHPRTGELLVIEAHSVWWGENSMYVENEAKDERRRTKD